MRRIFMAAVLAGLVFLPASAEVQAQAPEPLEVGDVAPDFSLPGAVRHGILQEPVSLSNYEGETVVLAFFFRARTKG